MNYTQCPHIFGENGIKFPVWKTKRQCTLIGKADTAKKSLNF